MSCILSLVNNFPVYTDYLYSRTIVIEAKSNKNTTNQMGRSNNLTNKIMRFKPWRNFTSAEFITYCVFLMTTNKSRFKIRKNAENCPEEVVWKSVRHTRLSLLEIEDLDWDSKDTKEQGIKGKQRYNWKRNSPGTISKFLIQIVFNGAFISRSYDDIV